MSTSAKVELLDALYHLRLLPGPTKGKRGAIPKSFMLYKMGAAKEAVQAACALLDIETGETAEDADELKLAALLERGD